jgi:hypothetical protein
MTFGVNATKNTGVSDSFSRGPQIYFKQRIKNALSVGCFLAKQQPISHSLNLNLNF